MHAHEGAKPGGKPPFGFQVGQLKRGRLRQGGMIVVDPRFRETPHRRLHVPIPGPAASRFCRAMIRYVIENNSLYAPRVRANYSPLFHSEQGLSLWERGSFLRVRLQCTQIRPDQWNYQASQERDTRAILPGKRSGGPPPSDPHCVFQLLRRKVVFRDTRREWLNGITGVSQARFQAGMAEEFEE